MFLKSERRLTFAVIGSFLFAGVVVFCAPAQSNSIDSPDIAFVLDGMRANRERLQTGSYRILGTYSDEITHSREFSGGNGLRMGLVKVFCVFDNLQDMVRFECTTPSWLRSERRVLSTALESGFNQVPQDVTAVFIRGSEQSCHYFSLMKRLEIWPRDTVRPSSMPLVQGWMDIRALGFYNLDEVFNGLSFKDITERKLVKQPPEVQREPDGTILLTWMRGDIQRWRCWIDPQKGFAPVRFSGQFRLPELSETQWRSPHLSREIEWQEKSGVWVPITYRDTYCKELEPEKFPEPPNYDYVPTYRVMQYVWNISWESVNSPIAKNTFNCDQLNVPNGTRVIDWRADRPIYMYTVGDPRRPMDLAKVASGSKWSTGRLVAIVANGAAIVVITALIFIRRLATRQPANLR